MTGKSTKSESGSKRPAYKYDRKRLSSRASSYAPLTLEDLRWLWASYKINGIPELKSALPKDIESPSDFSNLFEIFLLDYKLDCFLLSAETEKDVFKPVGFVLLWSRGRLLEISNFIWFEWATPRSRLAAAINFLNQFRSTVHEPTGRKYKLVGFVEESDKNKAFFNRIEQYKVLRKIGRSYDFYETGPAMVYETR